MRAIVFIEFFIIIFLIIAIKKYFRRFKEHLYLSNNKKFRIDDKIKGPRLIAIIILTIIAVIWFAWQIYGVIKGIDIFFKLIYTVAGSVYFYYYVVSVLYQSFTDDEDLSGVVVAVLVPVYNENEEALRNCLKSIFAQTHPPYEIHIVNDGSQIDYEDIQVYVKEECERLNIRYTWEKQKNSGKRTAQITGFKNVTVMDNMIIATIDSDGILDPRAFEEGLKPFKHEDVVSVAGMIVCNNINEKWLVKIAELIFISQQLVERAFMSTCGCVPVNSGALAFYRHKIISRGVEYGYLRETFDSNHVEISDDSFMTLIGLSEGRCVFQYTSQVYSDMPILLKQHAKQQIRWNKGAFIRGFWRLKYSRFGSIIFMKQLFSWVFFPVLLSIMIYILFFIEGSLESYLGFFLLPAAFGYLSYFRYLEIDRGDMSKWEQLKLILIYTPLAVFWNLFVIKPIKIYAMITVNKMKWGTRTSVQK